MAAIELRTEIPGPRSRALREARRQWVSAGVSEASHGIVFERGMGARHAGGGQAPRFVDPVQGGVPRRLAVGA